MYPCLKSNNDEDDEEDFFFGANVFLFARICSGWLGHPLPPIPPGLQSSSRGGSWPNVANPTLRAQQKEGVEGLSLGCPTAGGEALLPKGVEPTALAGSQNSLKKGLMSSVGAFAPIIASIFNQSNNAENCVFEQPLGHIFVLPFQPKFGVYPPPFVV